LADTAGRADYVADGLPWRQFTKGLGEYRRSHFVGALEWMHKAIASSGQKELPLWTHERERNCGAAARLVAAMAHQQLRQMDEARSTLAQARALLLDGTASPDSSDLGREWPDWLTAQILLREAETLIDGSAN
jgi:hypothetical protein